MLRYVKIITFIIVMLHSTYLNLPEFECETMYKELQSQYEWLNLRFFYYVYFKSLTHKLDPRYVCSIIHSESYDRKYRRTLRQMQYAVSTAGARGFMQVIPKYHYKGPAWHVHDLHINLSLGMKYLKFCIKKAEGDLIEAARMYNAGTNSCRKRYNNWDEYVYPVIENYVRSVTLTSL